MKRYGRNQRRAHRARVAHLEERLLQESTHHLYLPVEGAPDLEKLGIVSEYSTTEEGSMHGMIERSACVTIAAPSSDLLDIMQDRPVVQFRGTQYLMVSCNMMAGGSEPVDRIAFDLVGVG